MSSGHIHNTNEACCSIPPVESEYKPKGSYQKVGPFDKAYVVSSLRPSHSPSRLTIPQIGDSKTHALICIYDIFGYWPQTEQGAGESFKSMPGLQIG